MLLLWNTGIKGFHCFLDFNLTWVLGMFGVSSCYFSSCPFSVCKPATVDNNKLSVSTTDP